ncbi:MAG: lysylphosphatidylglycerol synthase transmembrane domain-containing protein [Bacteroidota bacterium]
MNKQLIKVLKYVGGIGLGAILLYFAFKGASLETIGEQLKNANLSWVLLSIGIGLFSHYVRALRWRMQFKASGYNPPLPNVFSSTMFMYLTNLAFPRAGEIARCTALLRSDKIPIATSIGTVIVERVFDVMVLFLLVLLAFGLESATIYGYINEALASFSGISSGSTLLLGAGGVLVVLGVLFWLFRKKIIASSLFQKVMAFAKKLWDSAISIRKIEKPGLFIVYTFIIWLCYWLMTYVVFFSLPDFQELNLSFVYFSLLVTIIGAFGYALPVPGGIGPYHAAVIFTFIAFQVHPDPEVSGNLGRTFAIIIHSSHLILQFVGGALGYLYLVSRKPQDSAIVAAG